MSPTDADGAGLDRGRPVTVRRPHAIADGGGAPRDGEAGAVQASGRNGKSRANGQGGANVKGRAKGKGRANGKAHRSRRVLIVDDNADAAELLEMLVRSWGHEAAVANEGASALDMAQGAGFDVVLLDIGLPGIDGYEVARRLRVHPGGEELFIVALTGFDRDADREEARAAGFDTLVIKPVEPEQLRTLLAR